MTAQPGDSVLITTTDEKLEGTLMPRPDILDKNITIVKLRSGYNIGIHNNTIKTIQKIKTKEKTKEKKTKQQHNPKLPTIAILSTGGTISSKVDYTTGGASADYTAEDFVAMAPELEDLANITATKVMQAMTENMSTQEWKTIAQEIIRVLPNVDGVVVTLGTDTLHYVAAALSFLLKNLNKPVVLTASQRSIDRGSSDAFMNLICAVKTAAQWNGAAVVSCLHASTNDDYCMLIRGTKCRKMHTSRRDAFRPINERELAHVYTEGTIKVINDNYPKRNKTKTTLTNMQDTVALVYVYPGMDPNIIDYHIRQGKKGIVLAATALGHVPTQGKNSLLQGIKKATKKIPVIIASQTLYGRVHPYVYTNLRKLSIQLNTIFVEDMLPETAYVKLQYALAQQEDTRKIMLTNIAGEITERELPDSFLA
jgi:glutamyl-tRNA(Gln) amidotransferase subunit D